MALTEILKKECPVCHKIFVEASRSRIFSSTLIKGQCGHIITQSSSVSNDESIYDSIIFSDNCKPRPYQIEALKFEEENDFRCIIADEQGLGKTIEVLSAVRLHPEKLLPAAIVVPTTVKLQWMREIYRICGDLKDPKFLTQIIHSGKEKAMPGFQLYILTYDLLKKDDIFEYVPHFKTLILDECQRIKNHLSDRAKAVQRMAKKAEHIIAMSGTPIKNNAGEYFTVLNLVAPTRFPIYQRFLDNYCDTYSSGWGVKVGGLSQPERFYEDTKDLIIRRTKAEVLKDLPALERKFYHVELDPKLNKAYARALEELEELLYNEESNAGTAAKIAIMSRLRHITGISKVEECTDFVTEFLLSCDRKITIFVHHQDVASLLVDRLSQWCIDGGFSKPLSLHSGLDGNARAALVEEFKENNSSRIMIASTLAAGEGINLQFCSDAIILERQWNPANEEQAEARFHRFGQLNPVGITYMLASGTIDEYFTELVEIKRGYVASALDHKEIQWEEQSLMKELAQILVSKGRERWKI